MINKLFMPLLFAFFAFTISLNGQTNVDSLETVLNNTNDRQQRTKILEEIIRELLGVEKDGERFFYYTNKLYQEAIEGNDTLNLTFYNLILGDYYYARNSLDTAMVYYKETADLYEKINYINDSYRYKATVGNLYLKKGNFELARKIFKKIYAETNTDSLESSHAFTANQLGGMYFTNRIIDSAEIYYVESVDLYRKIKDTIEMLRPMNNLAGVYFMQQNSSMALETMLEVKNIREKLGNPQDLMISYGLLGVLYESLSDYETSLNYTKRAYDLSKKTNNFTNAASYLHTIANIYIANEDYEKGLIYINEAADITKNANLKTKLQIISAKGSMLVSLNRFEEAIYELEEGIQLADESNSLPSIKSELNLTLARAYLKSGDLEKAKKIALQEKEFIKNPSEIDRFNLLMADIYYTEKNYSKAIQYGELCYENYIKRQILSSSYFLADLLSNSYEQKGDYKQALIYNKSYKTLSDSLNNIEKVRSVTAETKDFEFEKEKEILALQKQKDEAILKAQTRQSRTIAIGIGVLALLGFGFFWNARRQNKIIATQNKTLEGLNTTKDRIFAIIGHDLHKPALAFRGITEKVNYLLKNQDFERLNKLGITIEREALSLNKLTDNLLNWALMQRDVLPHHPVNIKVHEIVNEVIELFTLTAQNKNIRIQTTIDTNLEVLADPDALRIIIRNLIDNAIKYTPHGGTVEIEAEVQNNQVQINIIDDGIGMEQQKLQSIFLLQKDKSQRGTAGEKGTGLGLHLVEELIKINKGSIKAMSQLGQGTSFNIALPIAK